MAGEVCGLTKELSVRINLRFVCPRRFSKSQIYSNFLSRPSYTLAREQNSFISRCCRKPGDNFAWCKRIKCRPSRGGELLIKSLSSKSGITDFHVALKLCKVAAVCPYWYLYRAVARMPSNQYRLIIQTWHRNSIVWARSQFYLWSGSALLRNFSHKSAKNGGDVSYTCMKKILS